MSLSSDKTETNLKTQKENIRIRIRKDLIGTLFISAVLLAAAGRWDWTIAWVYIALNFLGLVVNWVVLAAKHPEVFAARADITKEDTKPWDKTFNALYGPLLLVIMAFTGIDAGRYGWSVVPSWVQWLSIGLFIIGWGFRGPGTGRVNQARLIVLGWRKRPQLARRTVLASPVISQAA